MSVIKFHFVAIGETRQEVIDELDSKVSLVLSHVSGEPWIITVDKLEKLPLERTAADLSALPFIYRGEQEVLFAGPTPIGEERPRWGDGYRPQKEDGTNG